MRKLIQCMLLFLVTSISHAQQLHEWYTSPSGINIELNSDKSQVMLVGHDRVTVWDTTTGENIANVTLPVQAAGVTITQQNFEFVDAAPDFSSFIYKVKNDYQLFNMELESIDYFPDFQEKSLRKIVGFDTAGWIVFFSVGKDQGFHRVRQDGNVSSLEFLAKEFVSNSWISKDHKNIYFTRDGTFRILNILTKKVYDSKKEFDYWTDDHLPDDRVTIYEKDNSRKPGKKIKLRYFINTNTGEVSKKLKRKKAQPYFPENVIACDPQYYSSIYLLNDDNQITLYGDGTTRGKTRYFLKVENRKTCDEVLQIQFSKSKKSQQQAADAATAQASKKRADEAARKKAMQPTWFATYKSKFPQLPATYMFDYENMRGVDVTNLDFLKNGKYNNSNRSTYALGKIASCDSGNVVLLELWRTRKSGMDQSSFFIVKYDQSGKQLSQERIAVSQKFKGKFPILSTFTIKNNGNNYSAVSIESRPGVTKKEKRYSGSCN